MLVIFRCSTCWVGDMYLLNNMLVLGNMLVSNNTFVYKVRPPNSAGWCDTFVPDFLAGEKHSFQISGMDQQEQKDRTRSGDKELGDRRIFCFTAFRRD